MKLYSWITNEHNIQKTQGGNKVLEIGLEYEEDGEDWRCNTSDHRLIIKYLLDENGKPTLYLWGNKAYKVIDKR